MFFPTKTGLSRPIPRTKYPTRFSYHTQIANIRTFGVDTRSRDPLWMVIVRSDTELNNIININQNNVMFLQSAIPFEPIEQVSFIQNSK